MKDTRKRPELSDLGKALERIARQERQMGELAHRTDEAERQRELAERQVRSLSLELKSARRRIAELESLT